MVYAYYMFIHLYHKIIHYYARLMPVHKILYYTYSVCGYIRAENLSKKMHQHSSVFLKLSGLVQILQSRALRQGVGVVDSSRSSFAKGKPGLYVFFSLWRRSLGGRFGMFL